MRPIVTIPNPVLTSPAKPVTSFDKRLGKLVRDMKETLAKAKNPKGVGLAAPQIGEPYRIFVARVNEKAPMRVFINPHIISTETPPADAEKEEKDDRLEGCLSIPKVWGKVIRDTKLTLTYQDETGAERTETIDGFMAVIIQHEVDHLNGILFTQRVLEQDGTLYEPGKDKEGKPTLEEIEL